MSLNKSRINNVGLISAKIAIVISAAVGGMAIISSSVFASLTATAANTSGGLVTTGVLNLTQAASSTSGITGGFETAITAMAPGDQINRYVVLTNGGTLDASSMTLGAVASAATILTTDGTKGLQVTLKQCSIAWSAAGACTGTESVVMSTTSALSLATPASLTLQQNSLLSGAIIHLQIGIALPASGEVTVNGVLPVGTIQGITSTITWTFTQTQKTGATTNS